ncbi:response regulator transcription factor [Sedimentibacter sp.]|uniref:response regulator transcription factor n=1 Tax=Sedimentibacter sp. TaxID=1960295 RepID=UPI0028A065F7|nr:response regulator transcription factor [Sedimentibacter sp.]
MRILVVEDDNDLCELLKFNLCREGYVVDICNNGYDSIHLIKQEAYDIILLDRMLPEVNGMDVLSKVRALGISVYIIMITALDGIGNRIEGLDAGADDYLVKPFDVNELIARIRAVSRRSVQWKSSSILSLADISLDLRRCYLTSSFQTCLLSKKECELLEIFVNNPNQILPRSVLLSRIWGPDAPVEDGNLDNYIHFLRKRLISVKSNLNIKTKRGIGYILEAPND